MSIKAFFEEFEIVQVDNIADGLGGYTTKEITIKTISGALTRTVNKEIKIAEKLNNKSYYNFYVFKGSGITDKSLIKRLADNKKFRITSLAGDKKTPVISNLNLEKFECEIC